jgi:hypothetical protein
LQQRAHAGHDNFYTVQIFDYCQTLAHGLNSGTNAFKWQGFPSREKFNTFGKAGEVCGEMLGCGAGRKHHKRLSARALSNCGKNS